MQAYKSHAVLLFLFSHHSLNIRWRASLHLATSVAGLLHWPIKHCQALHWHACLLARLKSVFENKSRIEKDNGGVGWRRGPGIGGRRPVYVTFQIRRCDWLLHLPPSLRCRAAAFCIATWQWLLICACSVSMGLDDGLIVRGESAQKML